MSSVIVRFQFGESGSTRSFDLMDLIKRTYGGAVTFLAQATFLIGTQDSAEEVFGMLTHLFTYDDKLFVGKLEDYCSLHQLPKIKPSLHKIAV